MNGPPTARPHAILFDWDNTLIDSWGSIHAANNATLTAMGQKPWTMAETRQLVRNSLRDEFPKLFGDRWEEARDIFYAEFGARHLQELRPLTGVAGMLTKLAEVNIPLGIVSNKNGDLLRQESDHLGWSPMFARLVGATDAAADKPAAEPIHLCLKSTDIKAGPDVWYVGDTAIDMECAMAAGCLPVLLRTQPAEPGEFSSFPPALVFHHPETLLAHIGL